MHSGLGTNEVKCFIVSRGLQGTFCVCLQESWVETHSLFSLPQTLRICCSEWARLCQHVNASVMLGAPSLGIFSGVFGPGLGRCPGKAGGNCRASGLQPVCLGREASPRSGEDGALSPLALRPLPVFPRAWLRALNDSPQPVACQLANTVPGVGV